ncbi:membrane-bound PQQ-dependent dehydrogenase, glucose/quinate/shikimate family [Tianweitania sp. BSSL-BM11]|uniref:Membrane-bound PQQ-dependent dehydrogenase, glucose/quinate/shikimate family n=1 Tax=Tianweitania aestuarii TaxID=2814886 RepID=A0ABS5RQT5_9HYPH|nr:pyrroloquinoline quinone-dependent dehydrogenase [Tianweitania aestuarii]MBS9719409.1 membrane-bound PQQ-dependent dehydrogenase, glucose/quinate/shikimate family [Tianweitania aestuarii]
MPMKRLTRSAAAGLFGLSTALSVLPAFAQDTTPPQTGTDQNEPAPAFPATPAPEAPAAPTAPETTPATPAEPAAPQTAPRSAEPSTPAEPAAPAGESVQPTPTQPAEGGDEQPQAMPATPSTEPGSAPEQPGDASDAGPGSATDAGNAAPVQAARPVTPQREVGADWPFWGGSEQATRYSPLSQITPENVSNLEKVWTYRTGDMPTGATKDKYSPEGTPLKIGNTLYICSAMNIMTAVDAATGEERWRYDPKVPAEAIPYGASCRGVSYYEVPDAAPEQACAARVIEATIDARLIAVDAKNGQPCEDFGENGTVDLWTGIGEKVPGWYAVTAPPAIVRGIVVTGAQVKDGQAEDAPSGVIRGFDAVTGELAWAWDLANPELTGLPADGETYTRGTPNMWTTATGDEQSGLVFLPLGNSSVDYWSGNRSEAENEWSTSLVALDVTTGKPRWRFQTVRQDVWDYDLGSQVTLIDFPAEGGNRPAVVLPSKQGDIYILDRETGESLVPMEEIKTPSGGVEDGNYAATQPASGYHTLRKDDLTEADMWGVTPLDQLFCRIAFRKSTYKGIYTHPTSDTYWIQYPGYNGGSDWGSVAIDPERGIIIANYNDVPNHNRLIPREEADERGLKPINETQGGSKSGSNAEGSGDPQAGAPYAIDVNAGWRAPFTGIPCKKPPLGGIRAIDLATGETLWDKPIGTARRNGPFGIPSFLPLTIGTPNNGGSVVTKGGLIFIAAATDDLIRAIDVKTGEVVWSDVLPAGGQANPIVYEQNGREYLVIQAGGHHFMETPVGDYYVAYALPQN